MGDYPEHDKLAERADDHKAIVRFFQWLEQQGYVLCETLKDERYLDERFVPIRESTPEIIADFLGIDYAKFSDEKDAMLAKLREELKRNP